MTKRPNQAAKPIPSAPAGKTPQRSSSAPAADDRPPEPLAEQHRAAIERGLEQARAGSFASDAEIETVFRGFQS